MESRSLAPLFRDPNAPLRDSTFHAFRHLHRAVRRDGWKLIRYNINGVQTTQLFNLKQDPWERFSLAGEPTESGHLHDLNTVLRTWMRATDDYVDLDLPDWGGITLGEGE